MSNKEYILPPTKNFRVVQSGEKYLIQVKSAFKTEDDWQTIGNADTYESAVNVAKRERQQEFKEKRIKMTIFD